MTAANMSCLAACDTRNEVASKLPLIKQTRGVKRAPVDISIIGMGWFYRFRLYGGPLCFGKGGKPWAPVTLAETKVTRRKGARRPQAEPSISNHTAPVCCATARRANSHHVIHHGWKITLTGVFRL